MRIHRTMAVGAAALTLATAGCSGDSLAENIIENQAGGNVDVDLDDGNVRIEGTDGTMEFNVDGGGSLPDGWPSDIPTPDGFAVQFSSRQSMDDETVWSVNMTGDGEATAVAAALKADFEANGFTIEGEFSQTSSGIVAESFQATKGDLEVLVSIAQPDGEPVTVTMNAGQEAAAG